MDQVLLRKIMAVLTAAGAKGMGLRELFTSCRISPKRRREFNDCLRVLKNKGQVVDRGVRLYAREEINAQEGVVTGLNRTFGFVRLADEEKDVFIPGRYFMGALPGDEVLVVTRPSRGGKEEGEIIKVTKEGTTQFTAILHHEETAGWFVRPDGMMRCDFSIRPEALLGAKAGDKVLCEIIKRGATHELHQVRIAGVYGDAQTAVNCAQAVIDLSGVPQEFSEAALQQARYLEKKGISEQELAGRVDLREECIFTIDSADSKDLDDAISIRRTSDGYELGVHIADVSHYVRQGNAIDQDAFERGTSIYFADRVIPMLPPELSNGICSLNPDVDRLAFSCTMQVSGSGELLDFRFEKTVIRSRIKGVYKEINAILDESASPEILQKYEGLTDALLLMKELADILTGQKRSRGAPEIETVESYIILDENSRAIGIKPRTRGASEVLIEEFMLLANEAAATYARALGIPFVYRVHEPPTADKLENLRLTLSALGMDTKKVKTGMPASVLAGILREAKDKPSYPVLNSIVLRSMSKAKYFEQPVGHYGLVLQNYAQFTSPIRRYPDLMIHRVLSEVVRGTPVAKLKRRFEEEVQIAARQSTNTELAAMTLERNCDDCYKAEYMRTQIGEDFNGVIAALTPKGMFIALPNSVEGFLKIENLPAGEYDFDGLLELRERNGGQRYRVGDTVRVKCTAADVSSGNVDFMAV